MIGSKRLVTTLTLDSFDELMSGNIEEVIMNILTSKFNKICYSKCFIISVNKIVHMSDIEFNQNDIENCSCNLNVIFDCTAEILYPDEIISDMKVLSTKPSVTTLGSSNKIAIIKEKVSTKEGEPMRVMCVKAIYETGSDKIKIGCTSVKEHELPISGLVHLAEADVINTKHVSEFASRYFKISGYTIEEVNESAQSAQVGWQDFVRFMVLQKNHFEK